MKPTRIIIHHSLTKDGATVSWGAIRKYHVETEGWRDIGYHYGIELVGNYYEIFVGRPETEEGAHCKEQGMNHVSIGICMVGNFDEDTLPDAAMKQLVRLVRSIMATWGIPKENIKKHHDYASYKSCPGKLFPWDRLMNSL
jgi:N-acetyl-anhydromuramyl-L-alanine amidase AmpD